MSKENIVLFGGNMEETVKTLKEIAKAENAIETLIALEGFEKELREIIERYNEDPYEEYCKKGVPEILREILG